LYVAHADAQVLKPVAPAFVDADGVIVSPFDNPVITATIPMGTTPRPGQMSIAMDKAEAWLYRGFGVWGEVHCPADDLLCAAVSGGDKLTIGATLQPNGAFDVPFGGTASLNIHGARLGTGPATMQLWQEIEQLSGGQSPTPTPVASVFSSVSFKTTPDTLLVPLNVVVGNRSGLTPGATRGARG
jgi:hypothetical protein